MSSDFMMRQQGQRRSSLSTHMSVLGPSGLLGAGVQASDIGATGRPAAQMSDAVLEAAKNLAAELQQLQDEYITNNFSDGRLPAKARFVTESWGQMSVLNTLMDQLEGDMMQKPKSGRMRLDPVLEKKPSGQWNELLKNNRKSGRIDITRRAETEQKRLTAVLIIQRTWRQYQFLKTVARVARIDRDATRKSRAMGITQSTMDENNLHGSSLGYMSTTTVMRVKYREKTKGNRLGGWEASVSGTREPKLTPMPSNTERPEKLPPVTHSKHKAQNSSSSKTKQRSQSTEPTPVLKAPKRLPGVADTRSKSTEPRQTPQKLPPISQPRRGVAHLSSAWTSGAPPGKAGDVQGAGQISATGLWRKTKMIKTLSVFGDGPTTTARDTLPPSDNSPIRESRKAQKVRWKDTAYRVNRVNACAGKFLAFDQALSKWTESNQGLFEAHNYRGGDEEALPDEVHEAGDFLVAASAMWRIMKKNLEDARDNILVDGAPAEGDASHQEPAPDLHRVFSKDLYANRQALHQQLSEDCKPINVALGRIRPLILIKRKLDRAKSMKAATSHVEGAVRSFLPNVAKPPRDDRRRSSKGHNRDPKAGGVQPRGSRVSNLQRQAVAKGGSGGAEVSRRPRRERQSQSLPPIPGAMTAGNITDQRRSRH